MINDFFVTTSISMLCLIFMVIIFILFIIKKKMSSITSKIFLALVISSIVSMVFYIVGGYVATTNITIASDIGKKLCFCIIAWELLFLFYMILKLRDEQKNEELLKKHRIKLIILLVVLVVIDIVLCTVLKLTYVQSAPGLPFGMAGSLQVFYNILGGAIILGVTTAVIIKRKKLDKLAFILFLLAIGFAIGSYVLEYIFQEPINDVPFIQGVVVLFLYLSIESQDAEILKEFTKSQKASQEATKLKNEFILNMSHELRTPMNTILGFSSTLINQQQLDENTVKDDIENINEASNKLLDLINSIQDISKMETNKVEIKHDNYSLTNLMMEISNIVKERNIKQNLIFNIESNQTSETLLNGDYDKIKTILESIILNAIDYTDYGEVKLNIDVQRPTEEYYALTYHIKNSGHAMKQEIFDRKFDDLIKMSNDNNALIDISSLRFIVAKDLIEVLGGDIEYINQEGMGTQYIINIKQKAAVNNATNNETNQKIN